MGLRSRGQIDASDSVERSQGGMPGRGRQGCSRKATEPGEAWHWPGGQMSQPGSGSERPTAGKHKLVGISNMLANIVQEARSSSPGSLSKRLGWARRVGSEVGRLEAATLLRLLEPRAVKAGARVCDSQRLGWSRRVGGEVGRLEVATLLRLLEPRSIKAGARVCDSQRLGWSTRVGVKRGVLRFQRCCGS